MDVLKFPLTDELPQARFEQWIERVISFSTEYSRNWAADCVIGKPTNYPRHGDLHGSWASRSYRTENEFIEVEFERACLVTDLHIYETFNPGAITLIRCKEYGGNNDNWIELWRGKQRTDIRQSRIFKPVLRRVVLTKVIRIDQRLSGMRSWSEIDAVRMIGLRAIEDVLPPSKFSLDLKRFHRMRDYHDVEFDFSHANVRVKSHLGILCSRSEMFKKMFSCGMKESIDAQESEIQVISMLEDVDPRIFELLLEFIYSNHVLVMACDVIPLYIQADFYAMSDLKEYLETYLKLIIVDENVLPFYSQMIELDGEGFVLKKMKDMCLEYILLQEERIMKRKGVKRCKVYKILKSDLKNTYLMEEDGGKVKKEEE